MTAPSRHTPARSILATLAQELGRYPPLDQGQSPDWAAVLAGARLRYLAPQAALQGWNPHQPGPLYWIRRGSISVALACTGNQSPATSHELAAGDWFPVLANAPGAAPPGEYRALEDCFLIEWPAAAASQLLLDLPALADFLRQPLQGLRQRWQRQSRQDGVQESVLQAALQTPLARWCQAPPLSCSPEWPLRQVLQEMERRGVGSMLVCEPPGVLQGILTRHDVVSRIVLAGVALERPVREVMVQPVRALDENQLALDAAMAMAEHGMRHIPILRQGRLAGMVSERDLFALVRSSTRQLARAIGRIDNLAQAQAAASEIRAWTARLAQQGIDSAHLSQLVSQQNDLLTRHLVQLHAARHQLPLARFCWLALGSEGRGEQTVATDQDNALVLADDASDAELAAHRRMAAQVNDWLDACGFPLCKGGVMAREPGCSMRLADWQRRFEAWIERGQPEDLLAADIYFDFRPIAGELAVEAVLQRAIAVAVAAAPRFLHQLAAQALAHAPPLRWHGGIAVDERGSIDLKLQGASLFVEAARIFALAHGQPATNTRERLRAAAVPMHVDPREFEAWIAAFDIFQSMRLRHQLAAAQPEHSGNRVRLADLNDLDQRILRMALLQAKAIQQRLALDYAAGA